ncbi:Sex peptide receptor, partial [Pseudolycoriella hygida]
MTKHLIHYDIVSCGFWFRVLRRMRCSTNIYLTALAVADIIYLLFIFILSLEHYPNIHHSKYKIYWSSFGLSHWFCDASGVVFLCFALSISTAFEYKLVEVTNYYNKSFPTMTSEALCSWNVSDAFKSIENVTSMLESMSRGSIDELVGGGTTESDFMEEFMNDENAFYEYNGDERITKRDAKLWEINGNIYNKSAIQICEPRIEIYANESDLGQNAMYKKIFYIFISTFGTFVPLILLATFNCFLVAAVHRSHKIRHTMTNTRQSDRSTAQENKVTVTLIAVVVLFLVCQTPSAIQLIYSMRTKEYSNVDRAINNVCNFLMTLNAACNFLLYCALSDKYRKTVKELFFGRKVTRKNTMSSTYISRYGSNPTRSSFYSKSPTVASVASGNIRNRLQNPTASRFSITPTDYANFQAEMAVKNAKTQSLAASDFQTENNRRQNSTHIQMKPLQKESSTTAQTLSSIQPLLPCKPCFCKSPSETSMTRAQSLVFPSKIKHSTNCKDHPHHKH